MWGYVGLGLFGCFMVCFMVAGVGWCAFGWFYLVVYTWLCLCGFDYLGFSASDFGFDVVVLVSSWWGGDLVVFWVVSGYDWFCLVV